MAQLLGSASLKEYQEKRAPIWETIASLLSVTLAKSNLAFSSQFPNFSVDYRTLLLVTKFCGPGWTICAFIVLFEVSRNLSKLRSTLHKCNIWLYFACKLFQKYFVLKDAVQSKSLENSTLSVWWPLTVSHLSFALLEIMVVRLGSISVTEGYDIYEVWYRS